MWLELAYHGCSALVTFYVSYQEIPFYILILESEWLPYVKYAFLSILNSICYKKAIQHWTKCTCYRSSIHPGHKMGSLNSSCYGLVMMATWGRPILLGWKPQTWSPQPFSSVTLPWQCEFYLWIQSRECISKYKYKFPSVKLELEGVFCKRLREALPIRRQNQSRSQMGRQKCTSDLKDKTWLWKEKIITVCGQDIRELKTYIV